MPIHFYDIAFYDFFILIKLLSQNEISGNFLIRFLICERYMNRN